MGTNRRDIELLISAKETTGRSFGQVVSNITALNAKIAEQVAAAERGEGSLRDLRESQEALAQAGRDLAGVQSQIDAYNKLVGSSEKVQTQFDQAKAKLEALNVTLSKAEKLTEAQEAKLQRYENAVSKTSAALEKNKTDIAAQAAALQSAGVDTEQLATAQTELVNSARGVGAGLTQVRSGIDNFGEAVRLAREKQANADRQAAAAEKELADAQRLQAAEGAAALRIAAEQQAERTRQLAANEAALQSSRAFAQRIDEAKRLGDASRFVQLFAESVNQVSVADAKLSALSGFRAVGQQAVEASNDLSRFVTSGQSFAVSSSAVADGLRAMIDPGAQALRTLNGVEQAIREADAAAGAGVKNVSILNTAYNNLSEASAALLRTGGLVDAFRDQETSVAAARQEFAQAQADVQRYGTAMAQAAVPTEQMVSELAQAEARLETTGRALAEEETRLGALSRSLREAGVDTANLVAEQARLEAAASTAGAAMARVETATGRNGARTNGLFGLKPQDLTNVGYQINDIVVSLTSGQKPLTVFVQQGAQLAQIPGFLSAIANVLLRWFPAIAVLTAAGAAIVELVGDAQRLKQASQDLATNPLGANIDVQKFADAQEKLEGLGASAEDARTATLALVNEGFDTAGVEKYSVAAQQLSERLGVDLVDATQMLVDIQKGGIETVYDLAEKTGDLTTADLNHAEALFEAGKAAEARQFILDRVAERNQQIADSTRSDWTPAIDNLKSAWSGFTDFLARVFQPLIRDISKDIDNLAVGLAYVTGLIAGKGFAGAEKDAYAVLENRKKKAAGGGGQRGESPQQIRDREYKAQLDEQYNVSRKMTNEQRLQLAAQKARSAAQKAGVSDSVAELAATKARGAEQAKIDKEGEAAGKRAASARSKAAREAEAADRKRDQAQQQLEQRLRQLNRAAFSGESASLEERLDAINEKYETIYDSIKKARSLGLTPSKDGTSLDEIERQVEATKDRLKAEESIKFYQDQAASLAKQRDAEIKNITDAQTRGALSTEKAISDAARINSTLSPQIVAAARSALEIASQLAGTNPSPQMVAWIAQLENLIDNEPTNGIVAKVAADGLDLAEDKLNDLLKQRDTLVKAYQTLGEMGVKSSTEVREAMKNAFAGAAGDIQPALDALRASVEALHQQRDALTGMPLLTDTAYNAWLLKIQQVQAGLQQTETYLSPLETQTFQSIANAGAKAFDTLTSHMANFIAGGESLGDVFEAVGRSILQSMADLANMIAQVIIKYLILRALETAAGLPPGTLVRLAAGNSGGGQGGGGNSILGSFFGLFHNGGVAGQKGGTKRRDNAANWAGAPKFHGGGMAGLKPDEYRAVLRRGEEILTDDNPRHIGNIGNGFGEGGGGGSAPPIKQVLLLDPDLVPQAMQSRGGQKSVLTVIRQNKETIKQMLG